MRPLVIAVLLTLLGVSCGLRLRGLDHDLAYDITSTSGAFITDEGWYHKSARSLALWGEWGHAMDRNIYSHTPLFALWMAGVFNVFGVSLEVARASSVFAFLISLGFFYLICRTRHDAVISLAACVAVSATLHVVTYSRMAIVEPTGVAVSLAALWLWIRYPARAGACVASVALAACATFVKVGFVFTLGAVVLLWLFDAAGLTAWISGKGPGKLRHTFSFFWRGGASRGQLEADQGSEDFNVAIERSARDEPESEGGEREPVEAGSGRPHLGPEAKVMLAVALTGAATAAAWLGVRDWAGRDWHEMQDVAVYEQTGTAGLRASLNYLVWSVEEFLLEEPQRLVLFLAAGLMAGALLLPWTAHAARRRATGRAWLAMALWATAGFVLFSMFEYRMPRYYYFLIYPLTFLALEGAAAFFALPLRSSARTERGVRRLAAAVLAIHLAAQIPDWGRWLDRESSSSQADMARAVAARITGGPDGGGQTEHNQPPVLLGLNAAFVALFDDRIRPLEWEFVEPATLCRRIDWWRPSFFLHYESQLPEQLCPGIVRELTPLDYHTVMGRWYYDSDVVLARIVYHRAGTSRGPRATMEDPE